jgi:hypothetical protein
MDLNNELEVFLVKVLGEICLLKADAETHFFNPVAVLMNWNTLKLLRNFITPKDMVVPDCSPISIYGLPVVVTSVMKDGEVALAFNSHEAPAPELTMDAKIDLYMAMEHIFGSE